MITWSTLQSKDVVMIHNGKRLGQMVDLDIDEKTGRIQQIIILDQNGKGTALFQKPAEIKIHWLQIVTIGQDVILVNDKIKQKSLIEHKNQQNE